LPCLWVKIAELWIQVDIANADARIGSVDVYGTQWEYYEQFPLSIFQDKIYQEQHMAKYLHTCLVMGIKKD
jgi:hypothetical protein